MATRCQPLVNVAAAEALSSLQRGVHGSSRSLFARVLSLTLSCLRPLTLSPLHPLSWFTRAQLITVTAIASAKRRGHRLRSTPPHAPPAWASGPGLGSHAAALLGSAAARGPRAHVRFGARFPCCCSARPGAQRGVLPRAWLGARAVAQRPRPPLDTCARTVASAGRPPPVSQPVGKGETIFLFY